MKPALAAGILASLFAAGSGLVWLLAGGPSAVAVLTGGTLPIIISAGSLLVFFARKYPPDSQKRYQHFVLTNFLVKVVFIGVWTTLILRTTALPQGPFVVSLLANFFAWHVFEAARYQSALLRLTKGAT